MAERGGFRGVSDAAAEKVVEAAAKEAVEDVVAVVVAVVDVAVEVPDAVEKTKKNGFQLRNSVVWSKKEKSRSWRKFICILFPSKSSKLSTFS